MEEIEDKLISYKATSEKEDVEKYRRYIKQVFDDEENYIIAITGTHGTGKTSLIQSYFGPNNLNDHCIISIFGCDNVRDLSIKTIKQLDSYKGKKKVNGTFFIWFYSVLLAVIIFIFLLDFSFELNLLKQMRDNNLLEKLYASQIWFVCVVLIVVAFISFTIRHLSKIFDIRKIKVSTLEIELQNTKYTKNTNLLETYSDTIIKILKDVKQKYVIFEDFDRNEPITKGMLYTLKEINNIYNIKNKDKKKKFIFLIDNSFFNDNAEFTKFFDISFPVVPYYSPSNAVKILLSTFDKKESKPSEAILYILNYKLDDIRLLKSIINDYTIYLSNISNYSEVSKEDNFYDRLFAILIYKNLFPDDYVKLLKGKGELHSILYDIKEDKLNIIINEINNNIFKEYRNENYVSIFNDLIKFGYIDSYSFEFLSIIHDTKENYEDSRCVNKLIRNDKGSYILTFNNYYKVLEEMPLDIIIHNKVFNVEIISFFMAESQQNDDLRIKTDYMINNLIVSKDYIPLKILLEMENINRKKVFLRISKLDIFESNDNISPIEYTLVKLYDMNYLDLFEKTLMDIFDLYEFNYKLKERDSESEFSKKVIYYIENYFDYKRYNDLKVKKTLERIIDYIEFSSLHLFTTIPQSFTFVLERDSFLYNYYNLKMVCEFLNITTIEELMICNEKIYDNFFSKRKEILSLIYNNEDETYLLNGNMIISWFLEEYPYITTKNYSELYDDEKNVYNEKISIYLNKVRSMVTKSTMNDFDLVSNNIREENYTLLEIKELLPILGGTINNLKYIMDIHYINMKSVNEDSLVQLVNTFLEKDSVIYNDSFINNFLLEYSEEESGEIFIFFMKSILCSNKNQEDRFMKYFNNIEGHEISNIALNEYPIIRCKKFIENKLIDVNLKTLSEVIELENGIQQSYFTLENLPKIKNVLDSVEDKYIFKNVVKGSFDDEIKLEIIIYLIVNKKLNKEILGIEEIFNDKHLEKIIDGDMPNNTVVKLNETVIKKLYENNFISHYRKSKNGYRVNINKNCIKTQNF